MEKNQAVKGLAQTNCSPRGIEGQVSSFPSQVVSVVMIKMGFVVGLQQ